MEHDMTPQIIFSYSMQMLPEDLYLAYFDQMLSWAFIWIFSFGLGCDCRATTKMLKNNVVAKDKDARNVTIKNL
jgi:hypothetical protein